MRDCHWTRSSEIALQRQWQGPEPAPALFLEHRRFALATAQFSVFLPILALAPVSALFLGHPKPALTSDPAPAWFPEPLNPALAQALCPVLCWATPNPALDATLVLTVLPEHPKSGSSPVLIWFPEPLNLAQASVPSLKLAPAPASFLKSPKSVLATCSPRSVPTVYRVPLSSSLRASKSGSSSGSYAHSVPGAPDCGFPPRVSESGAGPALGISKSCSGSCYCLALGTSKSHLSSDSIPT